jgi:RNA polymerase sigma-70 factor (ECF subfamily)
MIDLERDRELVERAKIDASTFGDIYDAYYARIFRYALKRTGDADVASDITAETFMKALKGLPSFKWKGVPLSAWLYRIAGNEIGMYFRKKAYAPASLSLLIEAGFDPEDPAMTEELARVQDGIHFEEEAHMIREELKLLPVKYHEVLALKYFEDKSPREIALILGKPEGTIRSLASRALGLLRKALSGRAQQEGDSRIIRSEGRGLLSPTRNV